MGTARRYDVRTNEEAFIKLLVRVGRTALEYTPSVV
jgi:hypothetical protein